MKDRQDSIRATNSSSPAESESARDTASVEEIPLPVNSLAQDGSQGAPEPIEYTLPVTSQVAGIDSKSPDASTQDVQTRAKDDSSDVIAPLVFALIALFMAFVPLLAAIFAIIALVLVHRSPKDIAYKSRLLVARVCAIVALFVNALVILLIVFAISFFAHSTSVYEHVLGNPYEVGESGFSEKFHPHTPEEQEVYDAAIQGLNTIVHPNERMTTRIVNMLNEGHLVIAGVRLDKAFDIDWTPFIKYCEYEVDIHITKVYLYPDNPNRASVYLRIDTFNHEDFEQAIEDELMKSNKGALNALEGNSRLKSALNSALKNACDTLGSCQEVHFICEMEKVNGAWKIKETEIDPLIESIY